MFSFQQMLDVLDTSSGDRPGCIDKLQTFRTELGLNILHENLWYVNLYMLKEYIC